ncbi:CHAT domain-containing protein [Mycena capillaripes]|nr:CHAT domain-containing protein [Mycena capillaripes]
MIPTLSRLRPDTLSSSLHLAMKDKDHKQMASEGVETPSQPRADEFDLKYKTRGREEVLSLKSSNNDGDLERKAMDYFWKAHDCLRKCKSAGNISRLDKAIALLGLAASTCCNGDPQYQECFNQFATAFLIRFIHTGKAEDIQNAVNLRAGPVLGHPVQVGVQSTINEPNTEDIIKNSTVLLTDFLQAHDHTMLENAILLNKEALKLLQESHLERWKLLCELSEGLLLQFHLTGDVLPLEEAITCLQQVQHDKPNRLICLCAALATGYKGPTAQSNMLLAMNLANRISHSNAKALKMVQAGEAFFRTFNMELDLMKLDAAVRNLEEAESLLAWGHSKRGPLLNQLGASLGSLTVVFAAAPFVSGWWEPSVNSGASAKFVGKVTSNAVSAEGLLGYVPAGGRTREPGGQVAMGVALKVHVSSHPDRGHSLNQLANALRMRFIQERDPEDIDEAIKLHREELEIHGKYHRDHSVSLNNLAAALHSRFKQTEDLKDIDEAIALLRLTVKICDLSHPKRGTALESLAAALQSRFRQRGDLNDIDEAIELQRKAVEIYPLDQDSSDHLSNLAKALYTRFNRRGDKQDIQEAIELNRAALKILTLPHPDRGTCLNDLANTVFSRFSQWGDPRDIDEAVELHRKALATCAASNIDRPTWLSSLASALDMRFIQRGDPADIDESLQLHRRALNMCPLSHPERSMILSDFSVAIRTRFNQQGNPKDNDEAIQLLQEALVVSVRSTAVKNLGDAVLSRFHQHGDPEDLDESIKLHRQALDMRTAPHLDRIKSLLSLGTAIHTRFHQRRDPRDIDEAIQLHQEALDRCTPTHPSRSNILSALGNSVYNRAIEIGNQKDIDEAIRLYRCALEIRAAPHPGHSLSLNSLATALIFRFEKQRDTGDINEAIDLYRKAMDLHPTLIQTTHRDPKDMDEAVQLHRLLGELSPAPHPDRGMELANFGIILYAAYSHQPNAKILEEAIALLQEASMYSISPLLWRYNACNSWATIAAKHDHSSCLATNYTRIDLLPQLAAFHLDIKSRHQMLTREAITITSLASTSALHAIGLKENNVAVEFLEASRSIFWAQALHLRAPLDHLANTDPQLARKLRKLSQQLEQASFRDISRELMTETQHLAMAIEAETVRCRKLNEEREETMIAVRKLPGFEDFIRLRSIDSLRWAAAAGPIIIFLASKLTCSALIVTSSEDVQHVLFPGMNLQAVKLYSELPRALSTSDFDIGEFLDARDCSDELLDQPDLEARLFESREGRRNMTSDDIFRRNLAEMWKTIVKPKSANPPRLWWCPTGPFAALPMHAAGIYDEHGTDCVSDYVVSSYTPTLAALLDSPTNTMASFKMTAVIEPNAPNCSPLPGTAAELTAIMNRVPDGYLTSLLKPTGLEVVKVLQESLIVHFACHGIQDSKNPLDSGLMLSDGRLKLSQIMQRRDDDNMEAKTNTMSLAFLSACETAKGDGSTPDEAMHLAATLLFAGFRGVVATMWQMNDKDGPKIADTFYKKLFKDCDLNSTPPVVPDLTKAAEALHLAVSELRQEPGMTFTRWVPFVHYGL